MKKTPLRDPDNAVLDDYEKAVDEATNNIVRITSGPEFEAWKKQFIETKPEKEITKTVKIPISIFDKFKAVMEKANLTYYL